MLAEQISLQDLQDGETLRKVTQDASVMEALERVVKKIHDDHLEMFSVDEKRSRKWLRGGLEVCSSFLPAIKGRVEDSERVTEEREEVKVEFSSPAVDGQGSGDLV